jgi:hypothetical protein
MRAFALSLSAFLALGIAAPRGALAEPFDASVGPVRHPFFVGATAGVGWVNPSYQGLASQSLVGASLGVHAGYAINSRFAVGFEFTTVERYVTRPNLRIPFSVPLRPEAGCSDCPPPPTGGWIPSTTLFLGNAAPRVEFSPFGESGPYVGASAGLAIMQLINFRFGFGGGIGAGVRLRVAKVVDVGLQADARGQTYADGTALVISGAAVFRPHF